MRLSWKVLIVVLILLGGFFIYKNYNKNLINKKDKKETVTLNLILKDHRFIPDTIVAPENTPIRIKVHNQDSTVEEFESHDLKREKIVTPGATITVRLAGLRPGEYKFFGEFHEDTALGKLIVKTEAEYESSLE
ncbi:MAG: cupredoxin domain-containing protein [Rickettsiaceae bacterium]|nr:cupredoxin domain-containing protein [Rickettsiaceae bacterium]